MRAETGRKRWKDGRTVLTDMNAWQVALLCVIGLGEISSIALIGKERKPITPGMAVLTLIINVTMAYMVVMA